MVRVEKGTATCTSNGQGSQAIVHGENSTATADGDRNRVRITGDNNTGEASGGTGNTVVITGDGNLAFAVNGNNNTATVEGNGSVAVAIMWRELFDKNGIINQLLGFVGIDGPAWLAFPQTAPWTLVFLHAWQFGSPMVIFLAALKQIPSELYEAAELDGATKWQSFISVTVPLITPIISDVRTSS